MTRSLRAVPTVRAERTEWYRIKAEAADRTADVYIYDVIDDWFGVSAQQFVQDFDALDVDRINLHIHSPGGSVYEAIAILNAVRRHKAHVVVYVEGLAASAASFIAMGGDEVVMARNAELMIHDASTIAWGDAAFMRVIADDLDRISNNIASIYAERAGGTTEAWREAMLAETWYSAQEAVDAGLADRVDEKANAAEDAKARFDLSIFAHAGRRDAPDPFKPETVAARHGRRISLAAGSGLNMATYEAAKASHKPPAEPVDVNPTPQQEGPETMPDITKGLRERLGIPADTVLDEDQLLAALDEALTEQAEPTATSNATPPPGTVFIDEGTLKDLQDAAREGREARQEQVTATREALVTAAVGDGRIPPARADHWRQQLEADPGAAVVLAALPKDTVPVTAHGYTGGVDESSDSGDRVYSKYWGDAPDETKAEA